ncbi:MAG TPA: hypothetical protein VHC97_11110 [Thermoanaerobaculia bacterium]|jgi:hypothetical protein|nr:hypothetical protein [Thermoanaerobaculia bacterium]
MASFGGKWNAGEITIMETPQKLLTIKLKNRPNATGYQLDLYAPTINAFFPDDHSVSKSFTGVLVGDNKIQWSNGTTWTRD